jgi:hypothetical protein
MSFFVVERDPASGMLRVLMPVEYPDRAAALAALSAAAWDGAVMIEGEVFIADLAQTTPVLVMPAPLAPSPASGAWEAPAPEVPAHEAGHAETVTEEPLVDNEVFEEALAEAGDYTIPIADAAEVVEAWDAEVPGEEPAGSEPFADEGPMISAPEMPSWEEQAPSAAEPELSGDALGDLASAIRKATTSLESAGVVAPDSIEAATTEPVGESWPWSEEEDAAEPAETPPMPAALKDEPIGGFVEPIDRLTEPASVVAEPAGVASLAEEDEDALFESLGDSSAEASSLIVTSALEGDEDAFLPKPVIMGDYDDAPLEAPEVPAPVAEMSVEADVASAEVLEAPADPADEVAAYTPAGDLDLDGYTCDDCVYVNTCPKVGQSTPKECGSFQWKSD